MKPNSIQKKKELRKLILEVLLEVIEDVRNYPPDRWGERFRVYN
jgi:hypothetical protein